MLTSSTSGTFISDGLGVILLCSSNALNNVCQDPPPHRCFLPPPFALCCSNRTGACCAQKMESSRDSSGVGKITTKKPHVLKRSFTF